MVTTKLKQMLTDDGAVSPVIGVILMVAVTVVLAAVIGAFVFGIGDSLGDPAPNAQIAFDYDSDSENLAITHDGGDSLTVENTGLISITGIPEPSANPGAVWGDAFEDPTTTGDDNLESAPSGAVSSGGDIFNTAGDYDPSAPEEGDAFESVSSGTVVEVQWESNGGDQSTTLGTFEAP